MQDERERAQVRVTGLVQGVFFRDSTRRNADRLGLSGWVRNSPDGSVEAVFEGPPQNVREMVRWCGQGPPDASVVNVDVDYEPARGAHPTGFEVR